MPPTLEYAFTFRATLSKDALPLGSVKGGAHRTVVQVIGGFIRGPGIEAQVLSGGDWPLLDPGAGVLHLDARVQARTEGGDMIYVHYPGMIKIDAYMEKFLSFGAEEGTTKSSDHYFVATPVFEVSSEELKWMEQAVFVSHGHCVVEGGEQSVEYEVYKVVSG